MKSPIITSNSGGTHSSYIRQQTPADGASRDTVPSEPMDSVAVNRQTEQSQRVKVRVYPQDPMVSSPVIIEVKAEDMGKELKGKHFAIDDKDNEKAQADSSGNYLGEPGTPQFDQAQSIAIASRTHEICESSAGHPIEWRTSDGVLLIEPHNQAEESAFYNEGAGALQFGSVTSAEMKKSVHSCLSADVVSHETGHAVMHTEKPEWFRETSVFWGNLGKLPIGNLEVVALDEAFADCSSMMMALSIDENLAGMIEDTGGDLSRHNRIADIAEEFGSAFSMKSGVLTGERYIRSAINDFHYKPAYDLPAFESEQELSRESHSYSRIWSGVFYDCFKNLYEKELTSAGAPKGSGEGKDQPKEAGSTASADVAVKVNALKKARDVIGPILMKAVDCSPPTARTFHFRDMALTMIEADEILTGGANRNELFAAFKDRGIISQSDLKLFDNRRSRIPALTLKSSPPTEEEAVRILTENREKLGAPAEPFRVEKMTTDSKGFTFIQYIIPRTESIPLPDGPIEVSRDGGLTLTFNPEGKLVYEALDATWMDAASVSMQMMRRNPSEPLSMPGGMITMGMWHFAE
ncbi:MAG: M36 family metallopeptidase [Candidatus Xenobiia bacterium LiM19]